MDSIKVIIVEDDRFTRRVIEQILRKHFLEITIVGQSGSVAESLELIREKQPDLVILDVQLEDGNAFELLQRVELINFKVAFMSAFQGYMEESMQFAAVDFIAKPFDENELVLVIDKAIEAMADSEYQEKMEVLFSNITQSPQNRSIVFPTPSHPTTIPLKEIVYAEAVVGGSNFYTLSGEIIKVPRPLRRYESLFTPYGFFRCHPLFVINLRMVRNIDLQKLEILLEIDKRLPFEGWRSNSLINKYNEITIVE